ncbi:MAG: hypothetical protein ACYC2I_12005 [Elusimicrobiales bacterium]
MFAEEARLKIFLYAAILLTLLGYTGRYLGLEPLHSQFFAFAAWAYVFFADNLAYRFSGASPAVSRPAEFLLLALWSLALSCVAELFNLRLGVWHYVDQPSALGVRWAGFVFAWAALLPSVFVTSELLASLGLLRGLRSGPLRVTQPLLRNSFAVGALLLLLALAAPGPLWPLACAAFFLLAEPLNYRLGLPSLLREWQGGLPARTLRLALAGSICGLLWTAWNGAAGAQRVFSAALPGPRVLDLPLAAYALFPLLALQAYALCGLASALRGGRNWEEHSWDMPSAVPSLRYRLAVPLLLAAAVYLSLRAVDARTVKVFLGWV